MNPNKALKGRRKTAQGNAVGTPTRRDSARGLDPRASSKPGIMSGDLLERLHEGASMQFGALWFETNRLLVNQALDAGMQTNRIDVRQMLSFSAYEILFCLDRNLKLVHLLTELKLLDLHRESAIWYLRNGCDSDAPACFAKAARRAKTVLAICQPLTSEAAA